MPQYSNFVGWFSNPPMFLQVILKKLGSPLLESKKFTRYCKSEEQKLLEERSIAYCKVGKAFPFSKATLYINENSAFSQRWRKGQIKKYHKLEETFHLLIIFWASDNFGCLIYIAGNKSRKIGNSLNSSVSQVGNIKEN